MTDGKKKRLSMLDSLSAKSPPAPSPIMTSSRPLRAARDAVDSHKVWDIDPDQITDARPADRLDIADVVDLRDSIEANGQTVPILLRRDPQNADRYLLVYGRRRLEAIRSSDKVHKVRALIAHLDDSTAVAAQISENVARRDLTYIEKALFAQELITNGFGTQTRVAEVLTVSKSSISMALAIVDAVGVDLIRAIGPAPGIGRPRWEALGKAIQVRTRGQDDMIDLAARTRSLREVDVFSAETTEELIDPSIAAFEAVFDAATEAKAAAGRKADAFTASKPTRFVGPVKGKLHRTRKGVRLEVEKGAFADWIEDQAQELMKELYARWLARHKD